jgi:hypothetical protein
MTKLQWVSPIPGRTKLNLDAARQVVMSPLFRYGALVTVLYLILVVAFPLPRYAAQGQLYDLKSLTQESSWFAWLYALLILALFGLHWLAWHSIESRCDSRQPESTRSLGIVLAFAALFALLLMWLYPINAIDLFQYFFRSRIYVVYHANPFAAAPMQFHDDPYRYTVGEWADVGSLYGPGWELLAAGAAWLTRGRFIPNVLVLKGASAVFYLGSVLLVSSTLRRVAPERWIAGTLLLAWNPLVLLEWVGNGHSDVVMMFFVLLGVWLWARQRHVWVLPALVMAALVKGIAAITIPLFALAIWLGEPRLLVRLRWLGLSLLVSVGLAVALYLPFGPPWQNMGQVVGKTTADYGFSVSALLVLVLRQVIDVSTGRFLALPAETREMLLICVYIVPRWLALAGLAALYVRQLVMVWRKKQDPIAGSTEALFACALLVPSYRIWYPSWSMALAALRPGGRRCLRTGTACLTAELSVLIYGYLDQLTMLARHVLGVALTFLVPILSPWLCRWARRREKRADL